MITAEYIGKCAFDLLNGAGDSCLPVHSRYQHGLNLSFQDELIYLSDTQKGIVPFGIHLPIRTFQKVNQSHADHAVLQHGECLTLTIDGQEILLRDDSIFTGELPDFTPNWAEIKLKPAGCFFSNKTGLDFQQELTGEARTLDYLFSKKSEEILKGLLYYLGRGLGLTPSGDDFLIGLLAVDHYTNLFAPEMYRLLGCVVEEKSWTTAVSNQYLHHAHQGYFSNLVRDAIDALLSGDTKSNAVERLTKSGSTSGWDTLAGMVSGIQYYGMEGHGYE